MKISKRIGIGILSIIILCWVIFGIYYAYLAAIITVSPTIKNCISATIKKQN